MGSSWSQIECLHIYLVLDLNLSCYMQITLHQWIRNPFSVCKKVMQLQRKEFACSFLSTTLHRLASALPASPGEKRKNILRRQPPLCMLSLLDILLLALLFFLPLISPPPVFLYLWPRWLHHVTRREFVSRLQHAMRHTQLWVPWSVLRIIKTELVSDHDCGRQEREEVEKQMPV